jgi:beta-lactamase class A
MRLPELEPRATWGICVRDLDRGALLLAHRPDAVHRTASVGKLLLLAAVHDGLAGGTLAPDELLSRRDVAPVADSGLWQHLQADALPLQDVALLVASVSDNLATNVLLHRVGLARVAATAAAYGLRRTGLHDVVRDERLPHHPPTLSTGTAAELVHLVAALPAQVLDQLRTGTDLSMVGSAFGLDPLAHVDADRGVRLCSKTGTDSTVRADVGLVEGGGRRLAYAVLVELEPDLRDSVLSGMQELGRQLRGTLHGC